MQQAKIRQIYRLSATAIIAATIIATLSHPATGATGPIPKQVKADTAKLLKDKTGRPYGGHYFPFINYTPTLITGKPCPRITTWNLVEETVSPFKVGYLNNPFAVQNAIDDFAEIIQTYLRRWPIETFYQDSKQYLGLDEYRMQSAEAFQKHWCLIFVAYSLLHLDCLSATDNKALIPLKTIGEACRQQSQSLIEALILYAHDCLSKGADAKDLLSTLFAAQQPCKS